MELLDIAKGVLMIIPLSAPLGGVAIWAIYKGRRYTAGVLFFLEVIYIAFGIYALFAGGVGFFIIPVLSLTVLPIASLVLYLIGGALEDKIMSKRQF